MICNATGFGKPMDNKNSTKNNQKTFYKWLIKDDEAQCIISFINLISLTNSPKI